MTTNGVVTTYGWLDFAPGCGAYVTTLPGGGHFPVIYGAETNATFLSRIPYEYSCVSGKVVHISDPLNEGECMVLRTRALTNDVGEVVPNRFSTIQCAIVKFFIINNDIQHGNQLADEAVARKIR